MVYAYTLHMLTIVIAKGKRVSSRGHLQVIKVCDYQIAYSKRIRGIYNS